MSISTTGIADPRARQNSFMVPRFGLTGWEAQALKEAAKGGQTAIAQISSKNVADRVALLFDSGKVGRFFSNDVRVGGLSLEDMSSRFLTLFGLYIPQGVLAIAANKHKAETNGRNILVWVMTFYLMQFLKNDNFGINSLLLNPFMIERGKLKVFDPKTDIPSDFGPVKRFLHRTLKPPTNFLQRQINRHFGMKGDYLAVLKDAGIELSNSDLQKALQSTKAPWASLDNNLLDLINNRYTELRNLVKKEGIEVLSKIDNPVSETVYHTYPKVLRRLNFFPMVSAALLTAATVYVIGGLAMELVYRFIAPLDKDFNAEAYYRNKQKDKKREGNGPMPQSHVPFPNQGLPTAPASPRGQALVFWPTAMPSQGMSPVARIGTSQPAMPPQWNTSITPGGAV